MTQTSAPKQRSFEELYMALENLVKEFENKNIPLEESVKKFKQGLKLIQELERRLERVEHEIKEIDVNVVVKEKEN